MPYIGKEPALVPIDATDIPDNSITSAKIVDGAIAVADIATDGVGTAEIAANAVTNSEMADDAIGLAELSATGTASSSTYLRGDNSWATVSHNPEGTDTKSTGESTTTKVLRTDGDGSSSWQTGAFPDVDQSWTGSQRATLVVDNDGSFDMDGANNFKCTPAGNFTLTFTNITDGQSGYILLINTGGHTVSAHANSKVDANLLATVTAAGTYLVSYLSDGTNVYLTNSAIYT